jgi:hypothetical protein
MEVFSHPLEVVALGRGDGPLPVQPEQLGRALASEPASPASSSTRAARGSSSTATRWRVCSLAADARSGLAPQAPDG